MEKLKIYSPWQIAAGSICGGPIAPIYFLKRNYDAIGDKNGSKNIMVYGSVLFFILLFLLPFIPEKVPNSVLPLGFAFGAKWIAENYQLSKKAIQDSEKYEFQSKWNVLGVSIGALIAIAAVYLLYIFALESASFNL